MKRYEAEWISKQHTDNSGQWDPDRDEFCASYHKTRIAAERAAIRESKKADQCEWIRVAEQEYNGCEWIDQRVWNGDWKGLSQ
jgi:hypothetical protein